MQSILKTKRVIVLTSVEISFMHFTVLIPFEKKRLKRVLFILSPNGTQWRNALIARFVELNNVQKTRCIQLFAVIHKTACTLIARRRRRS